MEVFVIGSDLEPALIRQIARTRVTVSASLSPRDPARAPSFPVDSSRNRRKWGQLTPFLPQTRRGPSPAGDSSISTNTQR